MNPSQARDQAYSILELFADWRPILCVKPISDFSGCQSEASAFCQVAPRSVEEVCQILSRATERGVPIRTRAQGHSLNGSSLPRPGEVSLSAENFRVIRFEAPETVTVGAGVVLWILQHFLRRHGYDLPVLNDGYPGPTVGGFIASGGFGPRSALYGGFWNNVVDVGMVDVQGNVLRVARTDPLFPWLFGSMGQLGIFLDATLDIVPLEGAASAPYPLGTRLVPPRLEAPNIPAEFIVESDDRLFWFTLFVPEERIDEAHRELKELEKRHSNVLRFQERYSYAITTGDVIAPLVYPFARKFTATGAWGWLTDDSPQRIVRLQDFDRAFMDLTASNPDYRRYVQSEIASGPGIYEQCFGSSIYSEFGRLKARLDPNGLLNRGSVFSMGEGIRKQPQATPPRPF